MTKKNFEETMFGLWNQTYSTDGLVEALMSKASTKRHMVFNHIRKNKNKKFAAWVREHDDKYVVQIVNVMKTGYTQFVGYSDCLCHFVGIFSSKKAAIHAANCICLTNGFQNHTTYPYNRQSVERPNIPFQRK